MAVADSSQFTEQEPAAVERYVTVVVNTFGDKVVMAYEGEEWVWFHPAGAEGLALALRKHAAMARATTEVSEPSQDKARSK